MQHLESVLRLGSERSQLQPAADNDSQPAWQEMSGSSLQDHHGSHVPIEMAERRVRYVPSENDSPGTTWPAKAVVPVLYDPDEETFEPDNLDSDGRPLIQIAAALALVGILILGALVIFGMPSDSGNQADVELSAAALLIQSDTPTLTASPILTDTSRPPSPTPSATFIATASATVSATASATFTVTATHTVTATLLPSQSRTPTPRATPTATMISTNTPLPTQVPTQFPTNTPIPLPTAFVASDSLGNNLLVLRQAINGPSYDCQVYNTLYRYIESRLAGGFENNQSYERFGRRILDEMSAIYQGFCQLEPAANTVLPEQYADGNRALDLVLWETILALGPDF
jgi:hypothetical protein